MAATANLTSPTRKPPPPLTPPPTSALRFSSSSSSFSVSAAPAFNPKNMYAARLEDLVRRADTNHKALSQAITDMAGWKSSLQVVKKSFPEAQNKEQIVKDGFREYLHYEQMVSSANTLLQEIAKICDISARTLPAADTCRMAVGMNFVPRGIPDSATLIGLMDKEHRRVEHLIYQAKTLGGLIAESTNHLTADLDFQKTQLSSIAHYADTQRFPLLDNGPNRHHSHFDAAYAKYCPPPPKDDTDEKGKVDESIASPSPFDVGATLSASTYQTRVAKVDSDQQLVLQARQETVEGSGKLIEAMSRDPGSYAVNEILKFHREIEGLHGSIFALQQAKEAYAELLGNLLFEGDRDSLETLHEMGFIQHGLEDCHQIISAFQDVRKALLEKIALINASIQILQENQARAENLLYTIAYSHKHGSTPWTFLTYFNKPFELDAAIEEMRKPSQLSDHKGSASSSTPEDQDASGTS